MTDQQKQWLFEEFLSGKQTWPFDIAADMEIVSPTVSSPYFKDKEDPKEPDKKKAAALGWFKEQMARPEIAPQGTDVWAQARKDMVTASRLAAITGMNPYSDVFDCFILYVDGVQKPVWQQAVSFGQRMEPMIRAWHERIRQQKVHLKGLTSHHDGRLSSWLGASPDGLMESGVVVEYKALFRRKIERGHMPKYYYPQVQLVMDVFDAGECEYVEFQPGVGFPSGAAVIMDQDMDAGTFQILRVRRNDDFLRWALERARNFWDAVQMFRTNPSIWDWFKNGYYSMHPRRHVATKRKKNPTDFTVPQFVVPIPPEFLPPPPKKEHTPDGDTAQKKSKETPPTTIPDPPIPISINDRLGAMEERLCRIEACLGLL